MKLLVAYDGSKCAQAALQELTQSGLPTDTTALVLTVAEKWSSPISALAVTTEKQSLTGQEREVAALDLARQATEKIAQQFPGWRITPMTCSGSPVPQIMQTVTDWGADLIAVGSHGWNAVERFAFGSVSLKVAHEAPCSVRIARPRIRTPDTRPLRLLIGLDGSPDANAAITAVTQRHWPPETETRLVTAIAAPDWQVGTPFETIRIQVRTMQQEAEDQLAAAGLSVSSMMAQLYATDLLLEEAERWKADTIFVGTRGRSFVGRLLIGSVSSAVAKRAKCSVEIVRSSNRN